MSKKPDFKQQLQHLYTWSAVGYIGLAALAAIFMTNATLPVSVGHLAKDVLASQKSAVLVPGSQLAFDLPIKWLVVAVMLLSAVVPVLYLTRLKKQYEKSMKQKVLAWRWIDLAISSSLMIGVVSMLSGLHDIGTLKLAGGFMVLTCVLGWLVEKSMNEGKKLVKPLFVTSLFTGALPWLPIVIAAVATPFFAAVRAPWYVYALYVELLAGFTLLALNQWRYIQKNRNWKDYFCVERNYAVISIATRAAFAATLIVGLLK